MNNDFYALNLCAQNHLYTTLDDEEDVCPRCGSPAVRRRIVETVRREEPMRLVEHPVAGECSPPEGYWEPREGGQP